MAWDIADDSKRIPNQRPLFPIAQMREIRNPHQSLMRGIIDTKDIWRSSPLQIDR